MTSAKNGNGFSCDPAGAEATISCPCCGGTLTPEMIDQILAAARRPRDGGVPRRRPSAPAPCSSTRTRT